jgi:NAD(P)-dependent dehydrogenase (short-subunit alcohol dehydrogenase family)
MWWIPVLLIARNRSKPGNRRNKKGRRVLSRLAMLTAAGVGATVALRSINRRRMRMDFADKVVVITGGSRGLGLALARRFANEGARLALLARTAEELEDAQRELSARGARVLVETCDVRDRYQIEQAFGRIVREYGEINVLVNNAGIIQVGPSDHMRLEEFEDAMAIHFWGPLYGMMAAMNYMRQQNGGRIVNIASVGGKVAVPHLAPYNASKFALVGLSDSMRNELSQDRIFVTTVSPGLMRTGSHVNAMFKGKHRKEYTWFSILDALPIASTDVQNAVDQIVEACRYGISDLVITPQARMLAIADELFPNMTASVLKLVNRLLPGPGSVEGDYARSGFESQSRLSPSALSHKSDKEIEEYNQLRGGAPIS